MKHLIAWLLLLLLGSQSTVFALAVDKDKLLALKPLCSERIAQQAANQNDNKLWSVYTVGLSGLALMQANNNGTIDNSKLAGLALGYFLLLTCANTYFSLGEKEIQSATLQDLGLTGADKELAAYTMLKNNADRSRDMRRDGSYYLAAGGLGLAVLTSMASGATASYRDGMYTGAAVFTLLGLFYYFVPWGDEWEIAAVDKVVVRP